MVAAFNGQALDLKGNVITDFQVEVRREVGGQPLATIYSDRDGSSPLGNPFTPNPDDDGRFRFHAAGGAYRVRVFTSGGFESIWRYVSIGLGGESDVEAASNFVDGALLVGSGGAKGIATIPQQTQFPPGDDFENIDRSGFYRAEDTQANAPSSFNAVLAAGRNGGRLGLLGFSTIESTRARAWVKQLGSTITNWFEVLTEGMFATDSQIRSAAAGSLPINASSIESASAPVALVDADPVALDWDAGINFTLNMVANRTLGNPTNGQPGTWRTILVSSDADPNTLSFGNQYGGELPTLDDITDTKFYLLMIYCKTSTQFLVSAIDGSDA